MKAESFSPDKPRVWSITRIVWPGVGMPYDLAPDGKRFAVGSGRWTIRLFEPVMRMIVSAISLIVISCGLPMLTG